MQNLGHNANLLPFSYDEEKAAVRKAFILREDHRGNKPLQMLISYGLRTSKVIASSCFFTI